MDKQNQLKYINLLKNELIVALGCTEPIAIALACAKAKEVLGSIPNKIIMRCNGNIIKNAKSVTVPNSNGKQGIEYAALLGCIGGKSELMLEVLSQVNENHLKIAEKLFNDNICSVELIENSRPLEIEAILFKDKNTVSVKIKDSHTNIVKIEKNGKIIYTNESSESNNTQDTYDFLTLDGIYDFVESVDVNEIKDVLLRQENINLKISNEGITGNYGMNVGATILKNSPNSISIKAKAMAAAGSDARMGGCSLPVVINCGSGNQGITASIPVIIYANELKVSEELKLRALALSNLVSLYQKKYIGRLSAYCGAVCAACGSGAAIAYLISHNFETVSKTITNTLGNVSGIICDGAKASCAAKIASCVDATIMACNMAIDKKSFMPGNGIIKDTTDKTIQAVGRVGKLGMKQTDTEILHIMLEN